MPRIIIFTAIVSLAVFAFACSSGTQPTGENPIQGKAIKSASIGNNLTVTLSNNTGKLKSGDQELSVAFTDASGKAVNVGAASINFYMPAMGSMAAMNSAATLTTTSTPGVYKAKVKVDMPGEWQAQVSIEGPAGSGKASMPVTAQ